MSDAEICERFQCEEIYLDELALLAKLADYYRLTLDDTFQGFSGGDQPLLGYPVLMSISRK